MLASERQCSRNDGQDERDDSHIPFRSAFISIVKVPKENSMRLPDCARTIQTLAMEGTPSSSATWLVPLNLPSVLSSLRVQGWVLNFESVASQIDQWQALLSREETERARRYIVPKARRNYIAARAGLRVLLGELTGLEPAAVRFRYSDKGKPGLVPEQNARAIEFSLSHSHDLGLIAITFGKEIGIDLEHEHDRSDALEVAGRFFAPGERAKLQAASSAERNQIFYRIWTRKEAVLKASGVGIASGLREPDVSAGSDYADRTGWLEVVHNGSSWCIVDIVPAQGYQAAVAVKHCG